MSQKELTAPVPAEVDRAEASETALPEPDLSVLSEQPAPVKEEKTPAQELAETTPASVGLVVALVVTSIVAAVVVAMWLVSPLLALLLGAGLIVVAVLVGAGWLAWRRISRRGRQSRQTRTETTERTGGRAKGGSSLWPFGRNKNGGGSAGGEKASRDKASQASKSTDAGPAASRVRPTPGGHRPETVIDVDLDDITPPPGRAGSTSRSRPTPPPPPGPGPGAGRTRWWMPKSTSSLPYSHHYEPAVFNRFGGEMSTTTTIGEIDQEAMRVANRYAGLIEKHETLLGRAQACREAAEMYRRDARHSQQSAEDHKQAARTIRDPNVAAQHARQARDAEAEAAREILAARYYEEQAEEYEAQARAIGF